MIFEKYLIIALMLCSCLSLSISAVGEDVKENKNSFIVNKKKMVSMIKGTQQKRVKRFLNILEFFGFKTEQEKYKDKIAEVASNIEYISGDLKFILGNDTNIFTIAEPNHQNQISVVVPFKLPEHTPFPPGTYLGPFVLIDPDRPKNFTG